MCGRYAMTAVMSLIRKQYAIESKAKVEFSPSYNIAPTQKAPIVMHADEKTTLALGTWGFLPPWAGKDEKPAHPLINARAETVNTSPVFRGAFAHARCVIPFTHFFEWKKARTKIPYAIAVEKEKVGSFAGIYSQQDGISRFAILTTNPNATMKPIHDRMPVILSPSHVKTWLAPELSTDAWGDILRAANKTAVHAFPVSTLVNSPANNFADILKPIKVAQQTLR